MDRTKGLYIYTDGSMIKAQHLMQNQRLAMGAGWIINHTDFSFKCGIHHFSLSTRPELVAILTVLFAIPLNTSIIIYTDSQAAIDRINGIMRSDSMRLILKMVNYSILSVIKQLILTKGLGFKMVKVKGHSEVEYND